MEKFSTQTTVNFVYAIEVNGGYHHAHHSLVEEHGIIFGKTPQEIRQWDMTKIKALEDRGFVVLTIWHLNKKDLEENVKIGKNFIDKRMLP